MRNVGHGIGCEINIRKLCLAFFGYAMWDWRPDSLSAQTHVLFSLLLVPSWRATELGISGAWYVLCGHVGQVICAPCGIREQPYVCGAWVCVCVWMRVWSGRRACIHLCLLRKIINIIRVDRLYVCERMRRTHPRSLLPLSIYICHHPLSRFPPILNA